MSDEYNSQKGLVDIDEITGSIIETAIKVHKELAPGLFETVYDVVLVRASINKGPGCSPSSDIRRQSDAFSDLPDAHRRL